MVETDYPCDYCKKKKTCRYDGAPFRTCFDGKPMQESQSGATKDYNEAALKGFDVGWQAGYSRGLGDGPPFLNDETEKEMGCHTERYKEAKQKFEASL